MKKYKKQKNYERLLVEFVSDNLGKPFEFGKCDCFILLQKALKIIYGEELYPDLPDWTNRKEAISVWKATGGTKKSLEQLGAKEINFKELVTGDIIIQKYKNVLFEAAYIVINRKAFSISQEENSKMFELSELKIHTACMRLG